MDAATRGMLVVEGKGINRDGHHFALLHQVFHRIDVKGRLAVLALLVQALELTRLDMLGPSAVHGHACPVGNGPVIILPSPDVLNMSKARGSFAARALISITTREEQGLRPGSRPPYYLRKNGKGHPCGCRHVPSR